MQVTNSGVVIRFFRSFEHLATTNIVVLSTRLAVPKQSFLNLLRQNGRRVTKVYLQATMVSLNALTT